MNPKSMVRPVSRRNPGVRKESRGCRLNCPLLTNTAMTGTTGRLMDTTYPMKKKRKSTTPSAYRTIRVRLMTLCMKSSQKVPVTLSYSTLL